MIIPPKKNSAKSDKTIKTKSLNGSDAIKKKINENNTLTVKAPVNETIKPKSKLTIGL